MVLCNFCERKETRNRQFNLPFTCVECEKNAMNYVDNNDIIYVDAKGNKIQINDDTILDIEVNDYNISDNNNKSESPIDVTNFKDALLASFVYTSGTFKKSNRREGFVDTNIIN